MRIGPKIRHRDLQSAIQALPDLRNVALRQLVKVLHAHGLPPSRGGLAELLLCSPSTITQVACGRQRLGSARRERLIRLVQQPDPSSLATLGQKNPRLQRPDYWT
jgi:hypothetical protein